MAKRLLLGLVVLLLAASTASAAVLVVDSTGHTPGSYPTLQEAVDAAEDGDAIEVVTLRGVPPLVNIKKRLSIVFYEFQEYIQPENCEGPLTIYSSKIGLLRIVSPSNIEFINSKIDVMFINSGSANVKMQSTLVLGLLFHSSYNINIVNSYVKISDGGNLYDKTNLRVFNSFLEKAFRYSGSINTISDIRRTHCLFHSEIPSESNLTYVCCSFEILSDERISTPFFTSTLEVRPNPFPADECSPHPPDATDFYGYPRTNPYQIGPFNVDANVAVTTQIGGYYRTERGYQFAGIFAPYSGPLALLRIGGQAIALNNLGLGSDKDAFDSVYTSEPFWLSEGSYLGAIDNSQVSWPYLRVE